MVNYFASVSDTEYTQLKDSIALVAVLIAGADGEIDPKEKEWATKVANIRTFAGPDILKDFYKDVGENFAEKMDQFINDLPTDTEERNESISEKLALLNPILAKLDQTTGATFYENLKSLATHVAKASGGFMRMWSISKEEAKWAELSMINPIDFPEPVDEEVEGEESEES